MRLTYEPASVGTSAATQEKLARQLCAWIRTGDGRAGGAVHPLLPRGGVLLVRAPLLPGPFSSSLPDLCPPFLISLPPLENTRSLAASVAVTGRNSLAKIATITNRNCMPSERNDYASCLPRHWSALSSELSGPCKCSLRTLYHSLRVHYTGETPPPQHAPRASRTLTAAAPALVRVHFIIVMIRWTGHTLRGVSDTLAGERVHTRLALHGVLLFLYSRA